MVYDYKSQFILGAKIDNIKVCDIISHIDNSINNNVKSRIGNMNINAANIGYENKWYKNYVNSCDIVFCDGKGIQLGLLIKNSKISRHIDYVTFIYELAYYCVQNSRRLFLLGSKDYIIKKAVLNLKEKFRGLMIEYHHGYFEKEGDENLGVLKKINKFNTQIIVVGFGMPLQEKWILDNQEKINANIILNGGAIFEWVSGINKPIPIWMQKKGLAWLYRLLMEPTRLFKRYVIGNPLFIYRVIKERIRKK